MRSGVLKRSFSLVEKLIYIIVPCLFVFSWNFSFIAKWPLLPLLCPLTIPGMLLPKLSCSTFFSLNTLSFHEVSTHTSLAHNILVFLLSSRPTLTYCISLLGCLTALNATHPKVKSFLASLLPLSLPASHTFLLSVPYLIERYHQLPYCLFIPLPFTSWSITNFYTKISVLRYHFNIPVFLHPRYHHHLLPGLAGDCLLPGVPDSSQFPLPTCPPEWSL